MQRRLVTLILVVFASLNAADGICCPDGCTRDAESALQCQPESREGSCALCLGAVTATVRHEFTPCCVGGERVDLPSIAHYLDAPPAGVERPPRS